MIKSGAFDVKFIGHVLRKDGQLPVYRGAADAALVLKEAERRLEQGAAVIVYPEGTATRDPDLWPMVAKTGVARLALASGAPVIPVAHWGTYDILPYGDTKPKLFPRKTVRTVAGPPVDLSQWAGQERSAKALRAATQAIMADITKLVADLRGETPPEVPYDMSAPRKPIEREPKGAPPQWTEERGAGFGRQATRERGGSERPEASAGSVSEPGKERPEASAGSTASADEL
jgi:hypothetical protein